MIEGSSVQSHGVTMLSLVEKLEDLKAGLNNDTYIDVILQSLPPSYDPFIVNYNMNGLEKSIHELINMLVQYEATTRKSKPSVLVGEASTSKAKGKGARRWMRKKGKGNNGHSHCQHRGAPHTVPKGKGKGKIGGSQQLKANDVCIHCHGKGLECPQLLFHPSMFVIEINMISNSASWVLGTGYGAHICNDLQVLQRSRKLSKDEMILRLGDGKAVAAEAVGSLSLVVSNHVRIELKDCYFVPSMVKNIISISMLDRDGYKFFINKNYFYLVHEDVYHTLGTLINGLYILQQSNLIMTAQHKRKMDDHENAQIWHARLGHIFKDRIRRLVDTKSLEIDDLNHLPTCESCLKGKMTKKSFVGQSAIAKGLLDLVHTDVCGPLSIPARGGFSYFITFTDDHSWYGYVYLMRYKSEAFGRFKEYRFEVENQTNRKIKALRSDRGGEYLSGEFIDYLKENGILSQWTPPGTLQLNGMAERRNRTLLDMTPYEIWHGKPASYKYLRVWGSPAYVKRLVGDKLDLRSSLCRFIGYPKETEGYYFYDPTEQKVFLSRNAVFLEKSFPSDNQRDEVLIEESSGESPHSTTPFEPTVHTDGVPIHRRSTRESRVPERYGFVGLTNQLDNDSKTYREAMSDIDSDKWLEAMKSEMDSMGSNQARLVAKGYTQRSGVDFEETYSPVAMTKSIRILLAIAAWYDYEI
ncbi:UNVERIFIED_CONTAM: hypothetical protein Sradi_5741600 [Sesamum radiatum]|uniref:Integrase catalytic domain-containing protein n=1 Tax=Sesamum radiatum TaxID=300843 RepID=A0AAW2L422_SESRA